MAVSRAGQKPAATSGLSTNGNSGSGSASKTRWRTHQSRARDAVTAAYAGARLKHTPPPVADAETDVPEEHQAQQNGGVLLGKQAHGGDRKQDRRGQPQAQAPRGRTANIEQQPAEDRHRRQQIRAAHDVGDAFGADRMDRPQRGREERRPGRLSSRKASAYTSQTLPRCRRKLTQ